jgi:hypothetical protein
MILGMTTSTFTLVHVLLSLVGIGSGLIVVYGMLTAKRFAGWTAIFLLTTVLTSLTGFLFPFDHLFAVACDRHHLPRRVGGCDSGTLCFTP